MSVIEVFLWAMLLMKWLTNFSPNSLKVPIDLGGNEENQDLATFFGVAWKALHIIALSVPWIDMLVQNIFRWLRSVVQSYDSMVGSLKAFGGMDSSTFCVNGELPSISKFKYALLIVIRFSIVSIFACISSHCLSILMCSLCLLILSLSSLLLSLPLLGVVY